MWRIRSTVLRPILLNYVNNMPLVVDKEVILKLFADDSNNCLCLQRALLNFLVWSTLWQIKLNIDKCLVLHLFKANLMFV